MNCSWRTRSVGIKIWEEVEKCYRLGGKRIGEVEPVEGVHLVSMRLTWPTWQGSAFIFGAGYGQLLGVVKIASTLPGSGKHQ